MIDQPIQRRKDSIKKQLFEYFGYDKKLYIDNALTQIEAYLKQGLDFQEVFEIVKNSIQSQISSKYLPSKPSYPETSRSVSTDKVSSSRYSLIDRKSHKKKESWEEYNKRHQDYYKEVIKASANFEKAQLSAYRKSPDLEFQSKVDEVRAAEAAKQRELQSQEVEFKRKIDQLIAERENVNVWSKQVQEKRNFKNHLKFESRIYRNELDSRSNYLKVIENSERERRSLEKDLYGQALNQQILEKEMEKRRVREMGLRYGASYLNDPSHTDSERSISSSVLPRGSPLKFLVQYGNFIPGSGRKGN